MRFFVFVAFDFDPSYDVEEFIDKHIVELSEDETHYLRIRDIFVATFDLLFQAAGNNALRRYDAKLKQFVGAVGQVALEAVAVGIARNIDEILSLKAPTDYVSKKIRAFWAQDEVKRFSASGVSGTKRLSETIEYGAGYFEP